MASISSSNQRMNRSHLIFLFTVLLLCASSCYHVSDDIEPKINYAVQDRYLKNLPSPFPPLTERKRQQDWGKEYIIALGFAHQLDLYQAITAFKRAEFLVPKDSMQRRLEIQYEILLCYFLAKKYADVTQSFERSNLDTVDRTFPAYHDLLVVLYESYKEDGDDEKAERVFKLIEEENAEDAEKLALASDFARADIPALKAYAASHPNETYITPFLTAYENEKKSVSKAQA